MYSGEMDTLLLQMRFATLHGHFSNLGLMGGKEDLKNSKSFADFFKYATELTGNKTPFIVLTPSDLRTRKLTITELRNSVDIYKPGIIGIDQISLMEDEKSERGDQLRQKLTNISEDLFNISENYKVPVLVAVQASRGATDGKKNDKAPDMEHISESDGIGQTATRTLALKQVDNSLVLALRKNRYGLKNQEWRLKWDVDTGDIGFITANQSQPVTSTVLEGEDLF